MAAGAVSQRKSHNIVILSFCNMQKGQAICLKVNYFWFREINYQEKCVAEN